MVRPRTLTQLLERAVEAHADRVLLIDPALGRSVSYAEFATLVDGAATALLAGGASRGDRVAVAARNGLEAAVAIWACARAQLIYLGLPPDGPRAVVAHLINLTHPALLLAQVELAPLLEEFPDVLDAGEVLLTHAADPAALPAVPDEHTTYMLIPTSGTTGLPKAVRITGQMMGFAAVGYAELLGLTERDRTAIHLPFGWVSGHLTQLAPTMHTGGSAVTMPAFSTTALVRAVGVHGVTWLDVVPAIWELLLRDPEVTARSMGSVRAAVFGGAPARPDTLDRVRDRLPGVALFDVYAQSETCAPVTVLRDDEALAHRGTVGTPMSYVRLRVVGAAGEEVLPGEPGRLWLHSPAVTPGYWGSAEPLVGADGWLVTEDLASRDVAGYLTLVGRSSGLVIRGGVNISLAAVEQALLATGLVAEAAAVGVPARVGGERVAAAVTALPGVVPDVGRLRASVVGRVGMHALPRPLLVVPDLPRNPNGKVDALALGRLLGGRARSVAVSADD